MIDKPTRIGNSELYNVRVLNMSVARYYGVEKDYITVTYKKVGNVQQRTT